MRVRVDPRARRKATSRGAVGGARGEQTAPGLAQAGHSRIKTVARSMPGRRGISAPPVFSSIVAVRDLGRASVKLMWAIGFGIGSFSEPRADLEFKIGDGVRLHDSRL